MNTIRKVIFMTLFIFTIINLTGCSQKKNIVYFQNIDNLSNINNASFEPVIQSDDMLMIIVSTPDPEAAVPFNLETTIVPSVIGQNGVAQRQQQLYLVDKNGMVDFPVLGALKFGGKTKIEIVQMLKDGLSKYVKNAIVNLRIMNYKVSVQGEVNKPGIYPINSERVTLMEALSLAGDLTIYGKRNNIIVIREVDGKKSFSRVDITKADFINSPYYYLSQNDLVYIEPNGAKTNSATFNQNTAVWIAIASLVSSAIFSILLINKN